MTPVGSSQKQKRRPHGVAKPFSLLIRGDAIVLKIQSAIAPGLHAASIGRNLG
ncbi:hypothetical protein [Polaromonas sp.]|uniref:hypothetical protein n=1 Tax=Polaromonas sp. TaxID=1869339 RepID=UPI001DB1A549|nr:hypothetical protein [Polaromonas sp.]MBT9476677.1 hypothetical protein [Polaromonas sp.]